MDTSLTCGSQTAREFPVVFFPGRRYSCVHRYILDTYVCESAQVNQSGFRLEDFSNGHVARPAQGMVDRGVVVDKLRKAGIMSCSRKTRAMRCLSSQLDV